jgi:hypothetical protein
MHMGWGWPSMYALLGGLSFNLAPAKLPSCKLQGTHTSLSLDFPVFQLGKTCLVLGSEDILLSVIGNLFLIWPVTVRRLCSFKKIKRVSNPNCTS